MRRTAFAACPVALAGEGTSQSNAIEQARPSTLGAIDVARLTARQLEVLTKAVQGKPNKVIARKTNLAEDTVKAYLSAAFRSLNVSNRMKAVFKAVQLGLKPPPLALNAAK